MVVEAWSGDTARRECGYWLPEYEISAHGAHRDGNLDRGDVQGTGPAHVHGMVPVDVSHGGRRACSGTVGGHGADANGGIQGDLAADLRERTDVRDAALRRAAGAQVFFRGTALDLLPASVGVSHFFVPPLF